MKWRKLSLSTSFFLCLAGIIFSSGFRVMPRISNFPLPTSENRFHQHVGDGYSEMGVLAAHEYWKKFGYKSTAFLPCIDFMGQTHAACQPYTHYPPGMYLFSSWLLDFVDEDRESAIRFTRIALYAITLILSALALTLLAASLNIGTAGLLLMAIAYGLCTGFVIFADHLFGHGIVLALQGLLFASVLFWKGKKILLYGALCIISLFLSVELIPTIFLAPLLIALANPNNAKFSWKPIKKIWTVAAIAFVIGMLLRLGQNAWQAGFLNALNDWVQIVRFRVLGISTEATGDLPKVNLSWNFWKTYFLEWLRYQRIMITAYGQVWLFLSMIMFYYRKHFLQLRILAGIFMISLAWNFIFVQHSLLHLFTVRYIVWPFVISLGFLVGPNPAFSFSRR